MGFLDSHLYRGLDTLTNLFLLNLLWLLACVPLITIFPATAALFAVERSWIRGREHGLFKPFFSYMGQNFVQSLIIGSLWSVIGLILVADYLFVRGITSWVRIPLFGLFLLVAMGYLATAVYLFPVMVHYQTGWIQIIKNSLFLAFKSPGVSFLGIVMITLAGLALYIMPISIFVIGSITAYLIYRVCHHAFQQIKPGTTEQADSDKL
jgi:uncharacterized membrane protein YesL